MAIKCLICGEKTNNRKCKNSFSCERNIEDHEYYEHYMINGELSSFCIHINFLGYKIYIESSSNGLTVMLVYNILTLKDLIPFKELNYKISLDEATKYIYELKRIVKNRAFI